MNFYKNMKKDRMGALSQKGNSPESVYYKPM